jgi:NadR type nicotinamide-nucleotide adenylyltransferase
MCPHAEIVVTPDDLPEEPTAWARRTVEVVGGRPDVVFSSEDYGPAYAAAMGAQHVMVDRNRAAIPISATQIRREPKACGAYLAPCVQAYFVPRLVLVGAESTGKTTLAQFLSRELDLPWVPEYGREYSEWKLPEGSDWGTAEFIEIAAEQQRTEDALARTLPKLFICDTNAWATGTWHERYMGARSPEVDAIGALDRADLYLIPDPTVPFVQDGLRDGEHIREWMHGRFLELLQGKPHEILSGTYAKREAKALELARSLLFAPST